MQGEGTEPEEPGDRPLSRVSPHGDEHHKILTAQRASLLPGKQRSSRRQGTQSDTRGVSRVAVLLRGPSPGSFLAGLLHRQKSIQGDLL